MAKAIIIFTDPKGQEFFGAYGPLVTERAQALEYASEEVAAGAAEGRMGNGPAFWRCEVESRANAKEEYRYWTYRVEAVEPCVCETTGLFQSGLPGVVARIENGRVASDVERCDTCKRYASDEEARAALEQRLSAK